MAVRKPSSLLRPNLYTTGMHCNLCIRDFVTDRATLGNKDIKSIFAALKRLLMLTFALKDLFHTQAILQHQAMEFSKSCMAGMHSQMCPSTRQGHTCERVMHAKAQQ